VTLEEVLASVVAMYDTESARSQSHERVVAEMGRFVSRLRHEEATSLNVSPATVRRFLNESVTRRNLTSAPSTSTQQTRLGAVRKLYRIARQLQLTDGADPTVDVTVAPRRGARPRPLTDREIERARAFSQHTGRPSRRPSILALAEATATPAEIAVVVRDDLDLDRGEVRLPGRDGRSNRLGQLTAWGQAALRDWVAHSNLGGQDRLVYSGTETGIGGQVSISAALSDLLRRASLSSDSRVKPSSVAAWAARQVFDSSCSIELAALTLGVHSLDQAAEIIDLNWRTSAAMAAGG
jgi:integrase/recombinase XerC